MHTRDCSSIFLVIFHVENGSRGWCGPQPFTARTRPLDAFGTCLALSSWCMQGEAAVMLPRVKHGCLRGSPEGAEPLLGQLKRSERRQIN